MSRVVVATGTRREAAVLRGSGWTVIPGGGDAAGLRARLTEAATGAEAILSFGMAGALDPALAIGDWVVGDRVTGAFDAECDATLSGAFAAVLSGSRPGPVYADGRMLVAASEKADLAARTGAIVVDMESHVAAEVARDLALPLAVVRCVSDLAGQSLPPAFAVSMRPDGRLAVPAMLRSLLAHPAQVGEVVRTGAGFAKAMQRLVRGGKDLSC